jgi:hypothetical protein
VPERSRCERGWRLAGLLVLFVIACFWMPLGARDAAGVSSVIPALGPSTLAQPGGLVTHATAQHHTQRPAPLRSRALVALLAVGLLALAAHAVVVAAAADDVPTGSLVGAHRSRGPPSVR